MHLNSKTGKEDEEEKGLKKSRTAATVDISDAEEEAGT